VTAAARAQRHHAHHQGGREEGQPDLERAVALHVLQVERAEEEGAEHADHQKALDDVGAGDRARPEQPQREQGLRDGGLADHERDQQHHRDGSGGGAGGQGADVTSTIVVDPDHQPGGEEHRARVSARPRALLPRRRVDVPQRADGGGDAHRDVDQ